MTDLFYAVLCRLGLLLCGVALAFLLLNAIFGR